MEPCAQNRTCFKVFSVITGKKERTSSPSVCANSFRRRSHTDANAAIVAQSYKPPEPLSYITVSIELHAGRGAGGESLHLNGRLGNGLAAELLL